MESMSEPFRNKSGKHGVKWSYGWVLQNPPEKKRKIAFQVFTRNLRNYLEHSSLVGYRYLVEPNRPWIERVIWMILHISTLCVLGMLVNSSYVEYEKDPVVTVVDSDNYPSHQLEFPGIAICNINRISRKAATKLATEIISANVTDSKLHDVLRLIKQLGNIYEDTDDHDEKAEGYLDEMLKKYFKGDYDVTEIMKNLTPNCEDALSACHFQGEAKNCADIFGFRKTQYGFCCTFNYVREFGDPNIDGVKKEKLRQPYYISSLGITNGLSLVMDPFVEDYYYPILPIIGWKITVFNARDYPDNGSGSVSEALVSPSSETFVELDVMSFYSTDEIRDVEIEKRQCIFQNELPGYTYSECLVNCRAAAIWETCKCRPFYLPSRDTEKICNSGDSACLHKYKEIYWTVLSDKVQDFEEDGKSYKLSLETTERCTGCYPACDDVRYYLQSSKTRLDKGVHHTELVNDSLLDNQSIVHIYFTKHNSVRLKQELSYYWYELLSNIGGLCGVFVGFSLISVVEFVYFIFCTLLEFWTRNKKIKSKRTWMGRISKKARWTRGMDRKRLTGTLYWNEFLSHANITKYDGRIQTRRY